LYDVYLNTTLCSSSLSSTSGTLTCILAGTINGTAITRIFVDGTLLATDIYNVVTSYRSTLGSARYLFAVVLIVTLPMLGIASASITIVLFIIGLFLAGFLVALDWGGYIGATTAIMWFVIAAIVLLVRINRSRREDG
jgi:hypothetical protein